MVRNRDRNNQVIDERFERAVVLKDPILAFHTGPRQGKSRSEAGHMSGPDHQASFRKNPLAPAGASTHVYDWFGIEE